MIGLAMTFPGGHYHATPWGAHVNEAAVEWPPSPWRLQRALVSAWHRAAPEVSPAEVSQLLGALVDPPRYWLPDASSAHTRHYMPDRRHRREVLGVKVEQNLVFDAFLAVAADRPLVVLWPAELDEGQESLLRRLASAVTYLGRSESWCDIQVVREPGEGPEVVPLGPDGGAVADYEVIRLLTPIAPFDLATLEVSTADLQGTRRRLKDPPGAAFLRYVRPLAPASPLPRRVVRRRMAPRIPAVIWALDGRPLPLLTQVEEVARAVRQRIPLHETAETGRIRVFPYASDLGLRPVRLDRVVLWAERGFDEREVDRACGLSPFLVEGMSSAQVPLLLGFGAPSEVAPAVFGRGRVWESLTPVVPRVELRPFQDRGHAALPGPAALVAGSLPPAFGSPSAITACQPPVSWLDFRRGMAIGARVEFPRPVEGPLVAERQPPGFGVFLCADGAGWQPRT